jgi:hypothetical protein
MATPNLYNVLHPAQAALSNTPDVRKPYDYNQSSTDNGLPANSPGGPLANTETPKQNYSYNTKLYSVQISISNFIASQTFSLAPNSIIDFTIEESLADWVTKGTLTFTYKHDVLDKIFTFRNDGYDTINVQIYPVSVVGDRSVDPTTGQPLPDLKQKDWELNYLFSIYNIEDLPKPPGATGAASASLKCKKLYFRDFRYHELSTNTIQYSTATSKSNPDVNADTPDYARSLSTGKIIKEVIQQTLTDESINKITTNQDDWDDGASSLFLTAPTATTAYDLLMYAYKRHVSAIKSKDVNDFCILSIERGPKFGDKGVFTLRPMSKYFSQAGKDPENPGEFQIEHFFIQDFNDNIEAKGKKPKTGKFRAPRKDSGKIVGKDKTLVDYSYIRSYEYVEVSPMINANTFVSRPVYSYDLSKREFNIEFKTNTVTDAKTFIGEQYVKQVLTKDGSPNNFQITIAENKKDKNINPIFSLYGQNKILREADGVQKLLQLGIFQNACIVFTVPGLTSRVTGRFIGIDRVQGSLNDAFDDKFCGQWFIINIRHIFQGTQYLNEITAIKLHRYFTTIKFPKTL